MKHDTPPRSHPVSTKPGQLQLCRWVERRFDKRLHPASLSRVLRRLDLSRQKTRPLHPMADEKAKAAFAKRGSATR